MLLVDPSVAHNETMQNLIFLAQLGTGWLPGH